MRTIAYKIMQFGEKALELVRELKRTQDGNLPPYNEDGIRQVVEEMRSLFEQNQLEVRATTDGERGLFSGLKKSSVIPSTGLSLLYQRYPVATCLSRAQPAMSSGLRLPPHDTYPGLQMAGRQRPPCGLQAQPVRTGGSVVHPIQSLPGRIHEIYRNQRVGPNSVSATAKEPVR